MEQTLELAELKLKIAERQPLSCAENRVAEFVVTHFEQLPYLGIEEVAKRSEASKTSVGRFVQNIGFQGFSRFKKAVVLHLQNTHIKTPSRIASRLNAPEEDVPISAKSYLKELEQTFSSLASTFDEAGFEQALDLFANKNSALYVFGPSSSNGLATYFTMLTRYVREDVRHLTPDVTLLPHHLLDMKAGDTLFVISYYRYSDVAVKLVEWFHSKGGKVIVLTNHGVNPYTPYCHVQLLVQSDSMGVFQSRVTGLAVVEALVNALTQRIGIPERFDALENILSDFDTFHY
ncbi:MurR/RpiR family transcriptional regulator [Thaumasiovibrio sp. DFM-14]|uniref:MurR/RpiR family transcriptional regulator n=1 Tax=Thaumasiovibrio sp. DFM-14 TaxID=3384792 RepID=UPI0039A2F896